MQKSDLAEICQIAAICHPDFPEDEDILAEKLKLAPDFCFVFFYQGAIAGYILAHPYKFRQIPALDSFLTTIPKDADVLYWHDLAILPKARTYGVGRVAVSLLVDCAKQSGYKKLALVAVNGSAPFWSKQGFMPYITKDTKEDTEKDWALLQKLQLYSADACYMTYSIT